MSRATVVSAVVHALLVVILIAAGSGRGPPPPMPPIIEAEFVSGVVAPAETASEPPPPPPVAPLRDPPPQQTLATASVPPPAAAPPEPDAPAETPPNTTIAAEQTPPTAPVEDPATTDLAPVEAEVSALAAQPAADTFDDASTALPDAHGKPLANTERKMLTKHLSSWTGSITADTPDTQLTWREDGQRYTAVLHRQPATDPMGMDHIVVEVTTELGGNRMLTELRMTRVAFSNFAQFVDRWDPSVAIHDDEIDGRFHSNSQIHVSGGPGVQPVFRGKVTLAAHDIETDGDAFGGVGFVNRRAMFPGGLETMVRRIGLAPQQPPAAAGDDVQRFEHDAAVTFYEDGSYGWRTIGASEPEQRRALTERPHYLIGADGVTLQVHGTVKGTVLVYTPNRIVIAHDLRYAHDPREPGASDYLGLVAERSVEIGEPDLTGPGDLEIYASIYARGQFAVRSYRSRRTGKLVIYGSLAAGSLTATEPRYATSVHFDPRLTTMRAPGFPLSDRYELESSSGEWHSVPGVSR
ncbi:MAG: hypothetical protein ABI640_05545 [Gammaproteobacteria bacterium]